MKMREGTVYQSVGGGGYIGWPADAKPDIRPNIDGPLLIMRNGEPHWLTWRERWQFWRGKTDAERLERKYRPALAVMAAAVLSSDAAGAAR
ncbi:hypothetical protein NKI48_03200 [Mesorhizobium sp. M0644]|uniref:hypothetical protein n=1 Tax=Mesorhizobium sp. M0644 TaxID=2956979 RepID=UPI00333B73B0